MKQKAWADVGLNGGITRRDLLYGAAGITALFCVGEVATGLIGKDRFIRPPGGQDEEHFLATCIKCDRCRSACPLSAVFAVGLEGGLINARTPYLSFHEGHYLMPDSGPTFLQPQNPEEGLCLIRQSGGSGYCDFCNRCIDACPTGALKPFNPLTQWLGLAIIRPDICIAYFELNGCRRCVDSCPFGAITIDSDQRPIVCPEFCNGCGVCESICPTNTYQSFKGLTKRGIGVEPAANARPQ
ncbi:MAG: 4Fe-4S dicluster domain-containing protein [Coriobacteriales bacterium]|nr:4Fe-4S dicluster domain-containing protein [Coriobacteriales bacterium]